MKQVNPRNDQKDDENRQVGRILSLLVWASWVVFLFVIFVALYYHDSTLVTVMMTGVALLFIPFFLVRKGELQVSSLIVVLVVLGIVTFTAVVGQGIRDLAIVAFPVILLFAGLTLGRRLFWICVGLALAAIAGLVIGEAEGWFVTKPFAGPETIWFYLLGTALILLAGALAIDLLASNMRRNLEMAQQEIAQRKLADETLRESEGRYRSMFEDNQAVMLIIDPDNSAIVDANPAACTYYGWNREELLSKKIDDINALTSLEIQAEMQSAQAEKRSYFIFKHHRADGSIRDVEVYGGSMVLMGKSLYFSIVFDVTERKRAEKEVENSEKRFHALIEHGRDNISLLAADGTLLWESPSATSTLGYPPNHFVGHNIYEIIHPDDQALVFNKHSQVVQTPGAIREDEFRLRHADGTWRWIECSAVNLLDEPGVQAIVLNYRDITDRKQAEDAVRESDERFRLSMEVTNDGLWDWNINTDGGYFSPGYYRMLGYEIGDFPVEGSAWRDLIHPDDREHAQQVNLDCIEGRCEQFEVEYRMKAKCGEWRWILGRGKCIVRDAQGRALRLLGTHMDITDRKRMEELLRIQSRTDAMTGIYNRNYFEEELSRFEHSRDFPISIVMADVDGLKTVNDKLGHAAGDELLKQAANLLGSVFRTGDVLARIGGDEFAVLLPATDAAVVKKIVVRIRERLEEQNTTCPHFPIHLSIGAATAEQGNLVGAFTLADQAMYVDKSTRKATVWPDIGS